MYKKRKLTNMLSLMLVFTILLSMLVPNYTNSAKAEGTNEKGSITIRYSKASSISTDKATNAGTYKIYKIATINEEGLATDIGRELIETVTIKEDEEKVVEVDSYAIYEIVETNAPVGYIPIWLANQDMFEGRPIVGQVEFPKIDKELGVLSENQNYDIQIKKEKYIADGNIKKVDINGYEMINEYESIDLYDALQGAEFTLISMPLRNIDNYMRDLYDYMENELQLQMPEGSYFYSIKDLIKGFENEELRQKHGVIKKVEASKEDGTVSFGELDMSYEHMIYESKAPNGYVQSYTTVDFHSFDMLFNNLRPDTDYRKFASGGDVKKLYSVVAQNSSVEGDDILFDNTKEPVIQKEIFKIKDEDMIEKENNNSIVVNDKEIFRYKINTTIDNIFDMGDVYGFNIIDNIDERITPIYENGLTVTVTNPETDEKVVITSDMIEKLLDYKNQVQGKLDINHLFKDNKLEFGVTLSDENIVTTRIARDFSVEPNEIYGLLSNIILDTNKNIMNVTIEFDALLDNQTEKIDNQASVNIIDPNGEIVVIKDSNKVSVTPFDGSFEFTKVGNNDEGELVPLENVEFILSAMGEDDIVVTSNDKGIVRFEDLKYNIDYTLKETKTIEGYRLNTKSYKVRLELNEETGETSLVLPSFIKDNNNQFRNYRTDERLPETGVYTMFAVTSLIVVLGYIINKRNNEI